MNILVIYNPVAGGGRHKLLQRFVAALKKDSRANVEVYSTKAPGDATDMLHQRHSQGELKVDVVVAVGGDGTTNEVINGLPPEIPLGVFATGTANVLAVELVLPKHPEKAAQIILNGKNQTIWPGRLNGQRFVLMVGVGYDAWVVNNVDLSLKSLLGKGAYVWAMLKQIAGYGKCQYQLTIDGTSYQAYSAIITNGQRYGGSFLLSRRADITEPSMQVLLLTKPGMLQILSVLLMLPFSGVELLSGVKSISAKHIRLHCPEGEMLQADGDPAGSLPAILEVDTLPLMVRVPA